MVEANYSDSSVIGNIIDGVQKSHFEEHLSLDECIEFIQANESDNIRHILLIHLSDNNSNEKEFLERVGSLFGHEKVSIATNGQLLEIE